nr:MAG TPA: L,D-transpeptidase catalytic domain [Bacteriophage sp.]
MLLEIIRFKEVADRTLGKFTLTDQDKVIFEGFTCEPAGPDTIESGKDRRIPQGLYQMDWHISPRFNRVLPILSNEKVSKSRCILIHSGNNGTHTEGCILLGNKWTLAGVEQSRDTVNKFIELTKGKIVQIKIINDIKA